jgi:hypothetical protein
MTYTPGRREYFQFKFVVMLCNIFKKVHRSSTSDLDIFQLYFSIF